ncbi:hypothetical protein CKM354_000165500 [Cercospora kikuchii]|uniref:Uncharacterized protein n=1 Tax=Cercospora kikuchii TaxID=84275 RepID=A0A9P3CGI3_9PEZI|nr:uncharacterized protein CKM354_000165500 [Cercospora kikuchii]GIZ38233.1 hypothetical protein CKM354_000165500 [Cercospora kikuchii]
MITRQQRKHQRVEASSLSHISEPAATGKTSFLDLSAELRNEIYSICLRTPYPVTLLGNRRTLRVCEYSTFGEHGQKAVAPFNPALLRCCKQIKDESISIFYGENAFSFRTSCEAQGFFDRTPDALRHLRFIKVLPISQPKFEIKRLLVTLKGAPRLRKMTLGFGSERPNGAGQGRKQAARFGAKVKMLLEKTLK